MSVRTSAGAVAGSGIESVVALDTVAFPCAWWYSHKGRRHLLARGSSTTSGHTPPCPRRGPKVASRSGSLSSLASPRSKRAQDPSRVARRSPQIASSRFGSILWTSALAGAHRVRKERNVEPSRPIGAPALLTFDDAALRLTDPGIGRSSTSGRAASGRRPSRSRSRCHRHQPPSRSAGGRR